MAEMPSRAPASAGRRSANAISGFHIGEAETQTGAAPSRNAATHCGIGSTGSGET